MYLIFNANGLCIQQSADALRLGIARWVDLSSNASFSELSDQNTFEVDYFGEVFLAKAHALTDREWLIELKIAETDPPQATNELKFIADLATSYVHADSNDDLFQLMGSKLAELLPNTYITMSAYNEVTKTLTLRYIAGFPQLLDEAIKILGKNPIGMQFSPHENALEVLKSAGLSRVEGGLYELSFKQIPLFVCQTLERLTGIKDIYTMGFARNQTLFGNAVILTTSKTPLLNIRLIETFINLSSIALQRRISDDFLQRSLQEKNLLIKEVHHRVKNNLQMIHSLLSLQAEQVKDEHVRHAFQDSRNRIQAMALIHERLYTSPTLSHISSSDYITLLCAFLSNFYQQKNISIRYEVESVDLPIDRAIPLGMIVNELVANALEHAFDEHTTDGEISIQLRMDATDSGCTLSISDNGKGLPSNINLENSSSLGLELVSMFAKQLHAESKILRGKGTSYVFTFKTNGSKA